MDCGAQIVTDLSGLPIKTKHTLGSLCGMSTCLRVQVGTVPTRRVFGEFWAKSVVIACGCQTNLYEMLVASESFAEA